MPQIPFTLISGAQTGVDRAALDAALALGVPCGGWCASGRRDETGTIPARYPVRELRQGGYRARTIRNLMEADGTLIVYFSQLEGGTELTALECMKQRRPYCLIQASEITVQRATELAIQFVASRRLGSLNVAGPRASKCPEAYDYTLELVTGLLQHFLHSSLLTCAPTL